MNSELEPAEVLRVTGVSKAYRKGNTQPGLITMLRNGSGAGNEPDLFYALQDINFSLSKGQVLGIIGPNGAGKSTLLKVLSHITVPSKGRVVSRGKITSILKIGAGFHPEISCRENIFIAGELYGMSRKEIRNAFDSIVDFSGIGSFLETPLKHFSNGMFLRLAFSLAFHAKVDLMLLDEVIGVGDAEFQLKAQQHIQSMIRSGTAIVMTTHNLSYITQFCDSAMLLLQGKMAKSGTPVEVIESYLQIAWSLNPGISPSVKQQVLIRDGRFELLLVSAKAVGKNEKEPVLAQDAVEVCFRLTKLNHEGHLSLAIMLYDLGGRQISLDSPGLRQDFEPGLMPAGLYTIKAVFPANIFNRGIFRIHVTVVENGRIPVAEIPDAAIFQVHPVDSSEQNHKFKSEAPFLIPMSWEISHHSQTLVK
ncbi:MAG TPA: ATP-binding cassette domain-containing protein [Chitinophagaceae bacterium]